MLRWIQLHSAALTFLMLFLVGLGLYYVPNTWWPWPWLNSIQHLLSHALMVAGILGGTVDSFLKRALIRDVGSIFIGWALPQEVRNYIRDVSQTDLVRKNFRAHYKLTPDGNDVIIDVDQSSVDT